MKRLNLGCGKDYKEGWVNVDFNKGVKADIYCDLTKKLPFGNNVFDEILLDNVIEHIERNKLINFLEELHRISKNKGIISIYTPHYSGMYAFKHLTHYGYFGTGTFDSFAPEEGFNGERYSKARFVVRKQMLLFFHHNLANFKFLSKLPINWIFNFNRPWQDLMERFQFLGFDEIFYELKVIKGNNKE